jgi:hypothetical protein
LNLLEKQITCLQDQIKAQKSKISALKKQLVEKDLPQEFTGTLVSVSLNPDLIALQNDVPQSYINTAGYVFCGLVL